MSDLEDRIRFAWKEWNEVNLALVAWRRQKRLSAARMAYAVKHRLAHRALVQQAAAHHDQLDLLKRALMREATKQP